ncbi:MAG: helix-turn-helix transcriptional regulator [Cyclobacteriaceae bacterium]
MDIINKNIRTLRRLENIKSQSEFGDLIGVPSHNINKYENNVIPKPAVLREIASSFNVDLHLFITKELDDSNFDEFKIEQNTEAKLGSIINQSSRDFEIKRGDLDRIATFFNDKLDIIEKSEVNEVDRQRLFSDLRAIFIAYNRKLKDFYTMQDNLADIIGERKKPNQF